MEVTSLCVPSELAVNKTLGAGVQEAMEWILTHEDEPEPEPMDVAAPEAAAAEEPAEEAATKPSEPPQVR